MSKPDNTEDDSKYADILGSLIKKGEQSFCGDGKASDDENGENTEYRITPKGILFAALLKVYGVDASVEKFEAFQSMLLKGLSSLSTGGEEPDMFDGDFNNFYGLFINISNTCGRMRELLEENGIEFEEGGEKDDN